MCDLSCDAAQKTTITSCKLKFSARGFKQFFTLHFFLLSFAGSNETRIRERLVKDNVLHILRNKSFSRTFHHELALLFQALSHPKISSIYS